MCFCSSIKAGTCWVNGHNMFDAAAGFGGYRESGFGRDGGKEVSYPVWCLSVFHCMFRAYTSTLSHYGNNEYDPP